MNEEDMECKVIASLMIMLDDKFSNEAKIQAMKDVKKIFEKQQKEIEARLEEIDSLYKMMSVKDDEIKYLEGKVEQYGEAYQILKDDIEEHNIAYVDTPEFEENYISKDKIKEIKAKWDKSITWANADDYYYAMKMLDELSVSGQESDQEGGQEDE